MPRILAIITVTRLPSIHQICVINRIYQSLIVAKSKTLTCQVQTHTMHPYNLEYSPISVSSLVLPSRTHPFHHLLKARMNLTYHYKANAIEETLVHTTAKDLQVQITYIQTWNENVQQKNWLIYNSVGVIYPDRVTNSKWQTKFMQLDNFEESFTIHKGILFHNFNIFIFIPITKTDIINDSMTVVYLEKNIHPSVVNLNQDNQKKERQKIKTLSGIYSHPFNLCKSIQETKLL